MVGHGVEAFDLDATDILMIENVGNLVCRAASTSAKTTRLPSSR